jgi:hypothetical protein
MPKSDLNERLNAGAAGNPPADYATVSERIEQFYRRYPEGRIVTELVSRERLDPSSQPSAKTGIQPLHAVREITFRALVFRCPSDREPAATGWGSEREADGDVNTVACLENTETSAIGRALANLGFTASRHRPSREEIDKADRERARLAHSHEELGSRPQRSASAVLTVRPLAVREVATEVVPPRARLDADPLQRQANALHDLLELLARAERNGFPVRRATILRNRLISGRPIPETISRLERRLRGWIASRQDRSEG